LKKNYDELINRHYRNIAKDHGLSSTSTMADEITRTLETESILQFVEESLILRKADNLSGSTKAIIVDVGCGNGYTLERLSQKYPKEKFVGIEISNELRALATARFKMNNMVEILDGDIRDNSFADNIIADIIICQRVLINLLSTEDQKKALNNIVAVAKPSDAQRSGGTLLFIESFAAPLARLNEARREFDLPPIVPAHHNLYLPDDFFQIDQLRPFRSDEKLPPPNFLSTHYYVTRVLHPILTPENKQFKRNSEFVNFLSAALKANAGDYSPLKLYAFDKINGSSD